MNSRRAIQMLAKGLLHPNLLISQKIAFRDITSAFEKVDQEDPQTLKLVLDIQVGDNS